MSRNICLVNTLYIGVYLATQRPITNQATFQFFEYHEITKLNKRNESCLCFSFQVGQKECLPLKLANGLNNKHTAKENTKAKQGYKIWCISYIYIYLRSRITHTKSLLPLYHTGHRGQKWAKQSTLDQTIQNLLSSVLFS